MQSQTREDLKPPEARRGKRGSALAPAEERALVDSLILDCCPP